MVLPEFILASAVTIVAFGFFFLKYLVIIPARKVVVLEELGRFKKVLWPGVHFVFPFIQSTKNYHWTYPSQQGNVVSLQGPLISFENAQMDIPPIACLTNDQIQMKVDVTIMYSISAPEKAVYETDDVLNLFYQRVQTVVRSVCNKKDACDVTLSKFETLTQIMIDEINSGLKNKGILCTQLILQGITIDPAILKANEDIYIQKRQQAMLMENEKAVHNRKIKSLEYQAEQARLQNQIDMESAEQEAKRNAVRGYTPEYLLKKAEIKALETAKTIYVPREFFTSHPYPHHLLNK